MADNLDMQDLDIKFDKRFFVFLGIDRQISYCKMVLIQICKKEIKNKVTRNICGRKYEFDEKYLSLVDFIKETIEKVQAEERKVVLPDYKIDSEVVLKMSIKEKKDYFDNLAEKISKVGFDNSHKPLLSSNNYEKVDCDGDVFCVHRKYVETFKTCFNEVRRAQKVLQLMDAQNGLDLKFDLEFYYGLGKKRREDYCRKIIEKIITKGDKGAKIRKEYLLNGERVFIDNKYSLPFALAFKELRGMGEAKVYSNSKLEIANMDVLRLIKKTPEKPNVKLVTIEKVETSNNEKPQRSEFNVEIKPKEKKRKKRRLRDILYSLLSAVLSLSLILSGLNYFGLFNIKKRLRTSFACEKTFEDLDRLRRYDVDDEEVVQDEDFVLGEVLAKENILSDVQVHNLRFNEDEESKEKETVMEESVSYETTEEEIESEEETQEKESEMASETEESEISEETEKEETQETVMEESATVSEETEENSTTLEEEEEAATTLEEEETLESELEEETMETEFVTEETEEVLTAPDVNGEEVLSSAEEQMENDSINDETIQTEEDAEQVEIDVMMSSYNTEIMRMSDKDYKVIDYSTIDWEDNNQIKSGYHLTYNNTTYPDISMRSFRILYYVTNAECNKTYEDALATASVILNRMQDGRYHVDALEELVMNSEQFTVWNESSAMNFVNNLEAPINEDVWNALYDSVFMGIRNNDYIEFKASWTSDYSTTKEYKYQFVANGNKYHNLVRHVGRADREDVKVLKLDL